MVALNNIEINGFHPAIKLWFERAFGQPTDVQRQAWKSIAEGSHTLIAAPTGSGKTLAALLPCIDRTVKEKLGEGGKSGKNGVRILYLTPLKALNNDIHDHLIKFIEQIDAVASQSDEQWPGIRCAVRTGDTPSSQRTAMLRKPPEVLVTTPESLFILLTSEKGRRLLETVEFAIVDEIHSLAADKRGAHLSISMERLEALCGRPVQRVGVSATQKPLERVARFLGGWASASDDSREQVIANRHPLGYKERPVAIIESAMEKKADVFITAPDRNMPTPTRESVWFPILNRLFELMTDCRSVLLFVNSRRLCERLCLRLNEHAGYEMAMAHHGSMAKERRLHVEQLLKNGELRCIVATSSLELGIDVGHVDLVIQLDSPLDTASGIQRFGRAGHGVGETSRGVIVVRQRGQLPEIATLGKLIAERDIEPIELQYNSLDVLSQHIVSIVAAQPVKLSELYRLIAGSECYRSFPFERLEAAVSVLAGLFPFARPLLDWNRDTDQLTGRTSASIAALTGAGTIPSTSAYPVHHADSRVHLGELDEEFIQESRVGDVFQLGTSSWMIQRMEHDRIYVTEAANSFSEIPFWRNEGPGRSYGLGLRVGRFLSELETRLGTHTESSFGPDLVDDGTKVAEWETSRTAADLQVLSWLMEEYRLDAGAARELIEFVRSQLAACELATDRRIVIEHYRDVMNQTHIILHNPFGRRVNRTWLLAIERQFEKLLPYRLYGNAKDNGIEFVLPEWDPSWLQSIWHVTPDNLEPLLTEAITGSPLLGVAFRHIAETSLLLSRSFTRTPLWQMRLRSRELLREALPFAGQFPFLDEAMRESLRRYLDVDRLKSVLEAIGEGDIQIVVRETNHPSPMAAQFLADYVNMRIYEGDGLDAAVQMQLLQVSKSFAGKLFGDESLASAFPPALLERERERLLEPDRPVGEKEGMLRLMKRNGDLSEEEAVRLVGEMAKNWLQQLEGEGAAVRFVMPPSERGECGGRGEERWICRDETELYEAFPLSPASLAFIVGRYAEQRIAFTDEELSERYPALEGEKAKQAVDELVERGILLQAPFADEGARLWSGRQAAARLVRLSVGEARKLAQPVKPLRWLQLMAQRQHALYGTRLRGADGLKQAIEKLQGLFLPVSHWESIIFPARVEAYRKEELDGLCATGEVLWIGSRQPGEKEGKIAFFLAGNKPLYEPILAAAAERETAHPELLQILKRSGASFLTRLSREAGKLPTETLSDLIDLAFEGHASNDQFAPLRIASAKKGKDWARQGSGQGRWYWTGSLADGVADDAEDGFTPETPGPPPVHWIKHMLDAYGLVTRDMANSLSPYSWELLLPILRRLEEWGSVTRGSFIEGEAAMQFTTPETAQAIRGAEPKLDEKEAITVLSAVDPANPFGLFMDWPAAESVSFSRKSGNYLVLSGGRLLYWIENNGKRMYAFDEDASGTDKKTAAHMKAIAGELIQRQKLTKLVIERWNGQAVTETSAIGPLEDAGAERNGKTAVFWLSRIG
ncbi:DEAD/DEAH box helicase [Paenibacillus sp. NPDC058071]|uniref:DEAD/DEAH box helicase n=1 Tax=Paenibacillus sp. NPDC058071 TaxID=3346326 RepID=UPI0036DF3E6D